VIPKGQIVAEGEAEAKRQIEVQGWAQACKSRARHCAAMAGILVRAGFQQSETPSTFFKNVLAAPAGMVTLRSARE
jgi:hypothetical protein